MGPGASGMYLHGDREHMDASLRQLTEDERQRLRTAFEKAWTKPEVIQARDRLMQVTEEYRVALHQALEEADSGVLKILEKTRVPTSGGFPFAGLDPKDADLLKKVLDRLRDDLRNRLPPDKRETLGRVHERVMNAPAVQDLVKQLEAAGDPGRRRELMGRLWDAFQGAARAEVGPREPWMRREGPPPGGPDRKDRPPGSGPPDRKDGPPFDPDKK